MVSIHESPPGSKLQGDEKRRVEQLLDLPTPRGICPYGAVVRLRSKQGRERLVKMPCRAWHCEACRQRKQVGAGLHFGTLLMRSSGVLWHCESDPGRWPNESRRLRWNGASWVRIGSAGEPGVVLGTSQDSLGQTLKDWQDAVVRLGQALLAIRVPEPDRSKLKRRGRRCHPVTNSMDWAERVQRGKSDLEFVGVMLFRDQGMLLQYLDEIGVEGKIKGGRDGWSIDLGQPDEEKRAELDALQKPTKAGKHDEHADAEEVFDRDLDLGQSEA